MARVVEDCIVLASILLFTPGMQAAPSCPFPQPLNLTESQGRISYSGTEAGVKCEWNLPYMPVEDYVLVFSIESGLGTVNGTDWTCNGELYHGTYRHCERYGGPYDKCVAYKSTSHSTFQTCQGEKLSTTVLNMFPCTSVIESTAYEYPRTIRFVSFENVTKSFNLTYIYLPCPISTTTVFNTSIATTPSAETSMPPTTEASSQSSTTVTSLTTMPTTSLSTAASVTTHTSVGSTVDKRANGISLTVTIISIVAGLLLLGIFAIVMWRCRKNHGAKDTETVDSNVQDIGIDGSKVQLESRNYHDNQSASATTYVNQSEIEKRMKGNQSQPEDDNVNQSATEKRMYRNQLQPEDDYVNQSATEKRMYGNQLQPEDDYVNQAEIHRNEMQETHFYEAINDKEEEPCAYET